MNIKDNLNFKTKIKPITFNSNNYVWEAVEIMCSKQIGALIVISSDNKIEGIVTERDMLTKVLNNKLDPRTTKIQEIMNTNIHIANENDNLIDWIHTMSNKKFRHLPVVDNNNNLVAIMSQGDFVAYTWPDLYDKFKQKLTCKLSKFFQITLITTAIITLGLIAFNF